MKYTLASRKGSVGYVKEGAIKKDKDYIVVSPWVIAFYGIMPSKSTNREITCGMCSISFLIPM